MSKEYGQFDIDPRKEKVINIVLGHRKHLSEHMVEFDRNLHDRNILSVECGDTVLDAYTGAQWRLVGGVVRLHKMGKLRDFVEVREGLSGEACSHVFCGDMWLDGDDTLAKQLKRIDEARKELNSYNKQFNANFIIPNPIRHGSAEDVMEPDNRFFGRFFGR